MAFRDLIFQQGDEADEALAYRRRRELLTASEG